MFGLIMPAVALVNLADAASRAEAIDCRHEYQPTSWLDF